MDALAVLKSDHSSVEALFAKFEAAGPRARKTKARIVHSIIEELAVHAAIEEQVFYPGVRSAVPDLDEQILEAMEEHHIVTWTLSELEDLGPEAENFDAKVTVLIESVRHHVKEEEGGIFPGVRDAVGREQLRKWGDDLLAAKKVAPTEPHPRSHSTSTAGLLAGAMTGLKDKAREVGLRL
jgi:hemerythrin superfamily protein